MSRRFTYYGSYLSVVPYDADAQAFFDAIVADGGSLTLTEMDATNTLVVDLKANSLWTKFSGKFIYPYVGGSATSHKYNLINPLNTDAAFRIAWNGGMTHNANGIQGNGTNAYGNTFYKPSLGDSHIDSCYMIYSRTNSVETGTDYGTLTGSLNGTQLFLKYIDNNTYWTNADAQANGAGNFLTDTRGLIAVNRSALNLKTLIQNGVEKRTYTLNPSAPTSLSPYNMTICCRNYNGSATQFSSRNYSFFCNSTQLTPAEQVIMYNLVQAFQTTLGRQV